MARRIRFLLAGVVAAACAAGLVWAISLGEAEPAAVKQAPKPPLTRHARSGATTGVPGLSEKQLRRFETATLGPEHAKEHALQRRAVKRRQARKPGGAPAARAAAVPTDPAVVGRWNAPFSIPVMAIHAAVLPTGKVMWFSYPKNPSTRYGGDGGASPNTAQAWLWNPATGQNTRVDPPLWRDPADGQLKPANIWCAGQSFTADGRLVVAGGNLAYATATADFKGLNKVYTFNPYNETWAEQPDMRHGRWYPSLARMADGRLPILSGKDENGGSGSFNGDIDLFEPSSNQDGRGTITRIGGTRGQSGQPPRGGMYPHMFAMPSGRMFIAGPERRDSWFLGAPGSGNNLSWSESADPSVLRLWGTGVPVPGGTGGSTKVMQLGGANAPNITSTTTQIATASAETFDEANPSLGWRPAPSMNVGRGHHNTVLLPDGAMVTVGGGVGVRNGDQWAADAAQRQIELWDPATGQWQLGPSQAESRAYHSIAMLLPDGRVVSAGDDANGGIDRDTAEIYEPPYLFKGARPTIGSAPSTITIGSKFNVDTSSGNVTRAALVAPSATTHAVDMNQRHIPLAVTQRSGGVELTAPASPDATTPGMYMLFLINDQGVPSVAKFVKLDPPDSPPPPPPPPTGSYSSTITGTAGLSGYWRFGESSGTTASPAQGSVSGTYGSGVTLGQAGLIGGDSNTAGVFTGGSSAAKVTFGDVNEFAGNAPFTLEAWVKPTTVDTTGRRIFSKEWSNAGGSQGYYLWNTNGKLQFARLRNGAYQTANGPSLTNNTRYHVVATYDGATVRLYLNGSAVASDTSTAALIDGTAIFNVGAKSPGGGNWAGTIDEPAVYDTALTATQVDAHYQAGG